MKSIYGIVLVSTLFIAACGSEVQLETDVNADVEVIVNEVEKNTTSTNYFAEMEIEGMTCAMGCAKTIEDKIKSMDGVVAAKVDFENKVASVEFDNAKTNEKNFIQEVTSIHDGQYQITKIVIEKPVAKSSTSDTLKSSEASSENADVEQLSFHYPVIRMPNLLDVITKLLRF